MDLLDLKHFEELIDFLDFEDLIDFEDFLDLDRDFDDLHRDFDPLHLWSSNSQREEYMAWHWRQKYKSWADCKCSANSSLLAKWSPHRRQSLTAQTSANVTWPERTMSSNREMEWEYTLNVVSTQCKSAMINGNGSFDCLPSICKLSFPSKLTSFD